MKILQVHNYYQYSGGEDIVVENEKNLLQSHNHSVIHYSKNNKEINSYSLLKKISLINTTYWSAESFLEIKELIKKEKPDICHVHNYMPLISPAVFYACNEMNLPVVHTLHNYRLLCANAYLFRDGKVCEECIGKSLYNSVNYGCYRNSKIQSYAVARMIEKHKKKKTWSNLIDAYIALTDFSKKKFIEGGLPEGKIFVKPNFLSNDPGYSTLSEDYFLFAGRLDTTKGIDVLLETSVMLKSKVKIKIAGEGEYKHKILSVINLEYLSQLSHTELLKNIEKCLALIFPSVLYENMPLTIIEAFVFGKPVIASNIGAMAEIIKDGKTGLLFEPGNAEELVEKIEWTIENKEEIKQMGLNARKEFEGKYTAEKNYEILMSIYERAIDTSGNKI